MKTNDDITLTATSAGTTQAFIPAGGSVTQQAIFFTGSNHDAVAKFVFINLISASKTPTVTVKGYVYNRNVDTRYEVFRVTMDTTIQLSIQITEPIGFNLSPTDVLYFVADSSANSVSIQLRFSLNEYQRV